MYSRNGLENVKTVQPQWLRIHVCVRVLLELSASCERHVSFQGTVFSSRFSGFVHTRVCIGVWSTFTVCSTTRIYDAVVVIYGDSKNRCIILGTRLRSTSLRRVVPHKLNFCYFVDVRILCTPLRRACTYELLI